MSDNCDIPECSVCGYHHRDSQCPPPNNNERGGGDADNGGCDGGGGSGGGSGDGGRPPPNDPPPPNMNVDDPNICPGWLIDWIFYVIIGIIICCVLSTLWCDGEEDSASCLASSKNSRSNCKLNKNLLGFFNKSGGAAIPAELKPEYDAFLSSVKNQECISNRERDCPGLVNFAGLSAGAYVETVRDTQTIVPGTSCKCKDSERLGHPCIIDEGDCSECHCENSGAELMLRDNDKIVPGNCWFFAGSGVVLVGLFFPVIVTGVTIHHPAQSRMVPGSFLSAPKDFEVWGYNSTGDPNPHFFGHFEFGKKNGHSEAFVTRNFTLQEYHLVQFNFLSNHGNKNYTAVYKVEVYGILDRRTDKKEAECTSNAK